MRQTTLSVVLEVEPASIGLLSSIIEKLKRDEEILRPGVTEFYGRLKWGVPTMHFLSMSVFQGADYDPIFVIEANFDGRPGPFWAQMEATLADYPLADYLRQPPAPPPASVPALPPAPTLSGPLFPLTRRTWKKGMKSRVWSSGATYRRRHPES